MSGLRKVSGLGPRELAARLRQIPLTLAAEVASAAAPAITDAAQASYDGGRTAYDDARPLGVNGQALDLRRTGDTRRTVQFRATGTVAKCVLGTPYAKYLIGKYRILPGGNTAFPLAWKRKLDALVQAAGDRATGAAR